MSVEELLTSRYFVIPRFQREYSWEEENVVDFWNDIVENSRSHYFIGSMVIYEHEKGTFGVVDGQQRLTTIMLLLCALRDAFAGIGATEKAEGIHTFVERKDREARSKFVLQTETSFPFLQDEILRLGQPNLSSEVGEEEKALKTAARIFQSKIEEKLRLIAEQKHDDAQAIYDNKVEWLTSIRDSLLELNIILIWLDNEEDAYLIFETLNTRGKDLALSDLVKNLFARLLRPTGDVDTAKIKWGEVLETIRGSDADLSPDTFIVHSWQSRIEAVTKAKAYPKLKSAITKKNASQELDAFIEEAKYYRAIFEPKYLWSKDERKITNSLNAFLLFKLSQPTPAVLALIRSYKNGTIKRGKLVTALRAIEDFHFQFTAVTSSRSSGGISGMYSAFARKLYEATDSNVASAEIKALIEKFRARKPSQAEFSAAFEQILYTKNQSSQRNLVRYILLALSHADDSPALGHSDELTIEHLVPQDRINENDWPSGIVGQIGNLILVDEKTNSMLDNKSFSDKKKILIDRGYKLPQLFKDAPDLNQKLIVSNTYRIAALAYEEIWTI